MSMPIWKLIYANLARLDKIAARIESEAPVKAACKKLEEESRIFVAMLLEKEADLH